jgi:hypothetical protein
MNARSRVCVGFVLFAGFAAIIAPVRAQISDASLPHDKGQDVAPVYEGWYKASDGTLRLTFGYLNRNRTEEVDIPIGPDNMFAPADPDQGQPTHFMPGKNIGVFTVKVPKGAETTKFTWTVRSRGKTWSIPANTAPEYLIEPLRSAGPADLSRGGAPEDNTPPVIRFAAGGTPMAGPEGSTQTLSATSAQGLPISVWVVDDGIPRPRAGGFGPSLSATWSKYRGPGTVTFEPKQPKIIDGKASTSVTFSSAGRYMLRMLASDGSSEGACCWSNAFVIVDVNGQGTSLR